MHIFFHVAEMTLPEQLCTLRFPLDMMISFLLRAFALPLTSTPALKEWCPG